MNRDVKGYLLASLTAIIYGISFIFTKSASENYTVLQILGWRFTLAFFAMLILWAVGIIKLRFKSQSTGHFIAMVLLFPIPFYIINTYGIKLTSASESGIILATIPLVTVLLNYLIKKERPLKQQIIGIVLTIVGIAVSVLSASIRPTFSPLGYGLLLVAVLTFSAYGVIIYEEKSLRAIEKTFVVIALGSLCYTTLGLVEAALHGSVLDYITVLGEQRFLPALLYLGVLATVVAFFTNISAIDVLGASRNAVFEGLSTLTSIVAGILILQEEITFLKILSAALIIGGILVASKRVKRRRGLHD